MHSENGSINLVCNTSNSPPSSIKWYIDNAPLSIDGDSTRLMVKVTNRGSSHFQVSLSICDYADDVAGNYTCEVGNMFGNDSSSYELEGMYKTVSIQGKSRIFTRGLCLTGHAHFTKNPTNTPIVQDKTKQKWDSKKDFMDSPLDLTGIEAPLNSLSIIIFIFVLDPLRILKVCRFHALVVAISWWAKS